MMQGVRVRRALAHAINRQELVDKIERGAAFELFGGQENRLPRQTSAITNN